MTEIKNAFPVPALPVNAYLWESLKGIDGTLAAQYSYMPFFPLADAVGGTQGWGSKPYVVYDQLMKFRPKPFYGIHKAQIWYWVRGQADDAIGWSTAIAHILDREDQSARDINVYLRDNAPTTGIYYHNLKVFQIDSAKDERMDLSVKQTYTQSMIIEVTYHITKNNGFT